MKLSIGWPAQPSEPLKRIMHANNGKPFKTKLAQELPELTRRERRAALREALKTKNA